MAVMSLIDVILSRKSIRKYKRKKVSTKVLNTIVEAGRQAPSAKNKQPWHFIVLTDYETKEKLSHGRWNTFVKDSAFIVVGCGYVGNSYARKWSTVDTTIAMQNMVIAAWAQDVGSCWIGDFIEENVKKLLNISEDWKVIALISFGYPAEKPRKRRKKPLTEIVSYDKY